MKLRRSALPGALVIVALAALHAQDSQERSLHVSVLNAAGDPVPGLGPSDFVVREDKVAREVLRVQPANDPMQIALLIDDSQSASRYTTDFREGFKTFVDEIAANQPARGQHSMAIITLAARPTIKTDYTSDPARLQKEVGGLFTQTDTASCLLDGIYEISQGIRKRESARPVIIAVTTEGPEVSNRGWEQALDELDRSGAAFHVIVVGPKIGGVYTQYDQDRQLVLDRGTKSSGGGYETLLSGRALSGAMKKLAAELTHQYLVTYSHPQSLIPPDSVVVTGTNPDYTVRGTLVRDAIEAQRR